jgi:hypothetical protein
MNAALARFVQRVTAASQWPTQRTLSTTPPKAFIPLLRDLYHALASPDSERLPDTPDSSLYRSSLSDYHWANEVILSSSGDGLVCYGEHRGFMPGMGETLTYHLLVGDEIHIEVGDYWEDNIADPEEAVFRVQARSVEALDRAIKALAEQLGARNDG